MQITVNSLKETEKLAKLLAQHIQPGLVIALNGDLGAGKTTFVKCLVKHSGNPEIVTSPTFVILNIYPGAKKFYHFDFYRLSSLEDIENIGGEELIPASDGITLIEWAEKIPEILPEKYLKVNIKFISENSRSFQFSDIGQGLHLSEELKKKWQS